MYLLGPAVHDVTRTAPCSASRWPDGYGENKLARLGSAGPRSTAALLLATDDQTRSPRTTGARRRSSRSRQRELVAAQIATHREDLEPRPVGTRSPSRALLDEDEHERPPAVTSTHEGVGHRELRVALRDGPSRRLDHLCASPEEHEPLRELGPILPRPGKRSTGALALALATAGSARSRTGSRGTSRRACRRPSRDRPARSAVRRRPADSPRCCPTRTAR